MGEIENIYQNTLVNDYVDFIETRNADDKLFRLLERNPSETNEETEQLKCRLSNMISDCISEHEKQGFIYGFRYAMRVFVDAMNSRMESIPPLCGMELTIKMEKTSKAAAF